MVVCDDLPSSSQKAVQGAHALTQYILRNLQEAQQWEKDSNVLVFLRVPDEQALISTADKLKINGVPVEVFTEPDLGNRATALAASPSAAKHLKRYPLMKLRKRASARFLFNYQTLFIYRHKMCEKKTYSQI